MLFTIFVSFVFIGLAVWAGRNQWLINKMLIDQERVMNAQLDDMLALFEQQVTDAIRALLWQAGDKFELRTMILRQYTVVRKSGRPNREIQIKLHFLNDLSILVSESLGDSRSQQIFTHAEITGLYSSIATQAMTQSAFGSSAGTYQRSPNGGFSLTRLALVHDK